MELRNIQWSKESYAEFIRYINTLADEKNKGFSERITPDSESDIIGIKVPILRQIAKEIAHGNSRDFLDYITYKHDKKMTHEEITIFGLVIGETKLPFGELCQRIRSYAGFITNWACCDIPASSFKAIKEYIEEYKIEIYRFLKSENRWEQRLGLVILLDYYLTKENDAAYALSCVNGVISDEYYVNTAQAWLISTAFVKQRDLTASYLANDFALGDKVLRMTVRKIKESYRVSDKDKIWADTLLNKNS